MIHEWLHGIVYPRNALVTIGKITGKISFVALASYPLKRRRFIVMCLLPFVLGIIPLLIIIVSPAEYRELNGLMFGMSCMGMVSPFPDVYNVFIVLKNANIKEIDKVLEVNGYHVVTSNPPYMHMDGIQNPNEKKAISRHED